VQNHTPLSCLMIDIDHFKRLTIGMVMKPAIW
jgi:GGDEF domain-containing protein